MAKTTRRTLSVAQVKQKARQTNGEVNPRPTATIFAKVQPATANRLTKHVAEQQIKKQAGTLPAGEPAKKNSVVEAALLEYLDAREE